MKIHLNLAASDIDRSVAFYRVLLNAAPSKHYHDYALFLTQDPGLELALSQDAAASADAGAHYGIVVSDVQRVDEVIARLQSAGLPAEAERDESCCYAVQTKVWTRDPDGRRWEVYTVHEELDVRVPDRQTSCC